MTGNLWKMTNVQLSCTTQEMIAKVCEIMLADSQTTHDVYNHVGLSYDTCQCVIADEFNMRQITAMCCLLNNNQTRIQACTKLQETVRDNNHNFLSRIKLVMNHKSMVMILKPNSRLLNRRRHLFCAPKCMHVHRNIKLMLIIFLTFEELCMKSLFHLVRLSTGFT